MVFHRRFASEIELSSEITPEQTSDIHYDFVTFLSIVQKMCLEILPITWQAARDLVGVGGTSRVYEAMIRLQTSFAFKCVSKKQKRKYTKEQIFRTLISEVAVLGHPRLRKHPNIVELQGICWDIPLDEVWPVLVFEKTQFGDLYRFLTLPVGRELHILDRLKLCTDIATGISAMHCNGELPESYEIG